MASASWLVGDVFERLADIPDGSVDLVLTSPPFLALRSYLPAGHPDKAKEIGSERTPAEFIDTLLHLTAEWRRVLAPHGSIAVELGDTYSGSGGAGGDYSEGGMRENQPKFRQGTQRWDGRPVGQVRTTTSDPVSYPARARDGWPLDKSLCGIPHLYHLSLAYGLNLLTGEQSPAGAWRVRNVVAWCRPNPPVGALGDKFRPATSYMTIACPGRKRYFDLDAVRTPLSEPGAVKKHSTYAANERQGWGENNAAIRQNDAGAPPLDHWWHDDVFEQDAWLIPTQPYSGSHYATWPEALCVRPISAMCPQRVCRVCGKPSERITGEAEYHQSPNAHGSGRAADDVAARKWDSGIASGRNQSADLRDGGVIRVAPTLGWTDCGHDSWRNGIVLDPFAGSGTTLAVAVGHGRDAIGIDLDERNADLARERVGMFLEVAEPTPEVA